MATIKIPATAHRQLDDVESLSEGNKRIITAAWKDKYSVLRDCVRSLKVGDFCSEGGKIRSSSLRRAPGNMGVLTLNMEIVEDDGDELDPKVLKETWSIKSCRNDVSILAYCGSAENSPNREWIECWQKEPDADIAATGKFRKSDGTISDLSEQDHNAATSDLMAKIRQGVESVIRFYPQITCRRIYDKPPKEVMKHLGYINNPSSPGSDAKYPRNLSSIIQSHQWLNIQDDAEENSDDTWTRTESWIGILKTDNPDSAPWDANLYGESRWPMPYKHQ